MEIGPYKVIDRLAVGGTAEIYRAAKKASGVSEIVVIKKLSPASRTDAGLRTLFELEADLGRRLDHPKIARMLEMGFEGNDLFLVFEYLDGPHLQRVLDETRKRELLLPFGVSASILCDLLDGLHYAHELKTPAGEPLGLIHRDVNPRNVLTSFSGRVALIDFGIARTQELEGGRAEEVVRGKLGSVAPEQLRREPLDRRADVFACGVMMYELLIGSHPYTHVGLEEDSVLRAILSADYVPPHSIAPELPRDVLDVLNASLSPKVRDRPESAEEIANTLRPYRTEDSEHTLSDTLTNLFPNQVAALENLRYLADS